MAQLECDGEGEEMLGFAAFKIVREEMACPDNFWEMLGRLGV